MAFTCDLFRFSLANPRLAALSQTQADVVAQGAGILEEEMACQPFSETYSNLRIANESSTAASMFGSCFLEARFTRGLRLTPERASPQADTVELTA